MNEIKIELECATVTITTNCCEGGFRLLEDGSIRLTEDNNNRILQNGE